ncbi:FAD-dependent monooxygenase [Antrihabitans sp. YC2-6]|uniref:FAD-dependent monooxygenase n=1 Tax=Antrihabitans sp. YC2-6 TaxID=2799498 RepID=UPI0018F6FDEF|nr:FAD-dependent monooxygenase [Antrihabitans sp. YC2-6]MBJ8347220.1 FAD-dependent monooxygenase [Antrihabitans sp. YC2-6]
MKIIVIGAGIGGLFAGITLREAGFDVDVYERYPEPQPVGAALTMWANALKLFQRYDMLEQVLEDAGTFEYSEFRTSTGRTLMRVSLDQLVNRFGMPMVCMHRHRVSDTLLSRFGTQRLHLGKELVGVDQSGDGVRAHFADGESATADVLIGADGVHSVVRSLLFPGTEPHYDGQAVWRGMVATTDVPDTSFVAFGRGSRAGWSPMGGGLVYWFGARFQPANAPDRFGNMKRDLLSEFGEWAEPLGRLIESTPQDAIVRNDVYALPKLPSWTTGRVALLGDAAHAMAPHVAQGACLAVEDATVLALRLAAARSPEEGLRRYSAERVERVGEVLDEAKAVGRLAAMNGPVSSRLRDLAMRLTPNKMFIEGFAKPAGYEVVG